MRKAIGLCVILLAIVALVSCKQEPDYKIGDKGPAGGVVFYDKGKYSDGWRYLEMAPADLKVVNGVPTVDETASGYSTGTRNFVFGFDYYSIPLSTTSSYSGCDASGSSEYLGAGKENTRHHVDSMGNKAASSSDGTGKTGEYAARLCDILIYTATDGTTYDDWFLPSLEELKLMYNTSISLSDLIVGDRIVPGAGFVGIHYWSSSEYRGGSSLSDPAYYAWEVVFYASGSQQGSQQYSNRGNSYSVRPVRAF